VNIVLRRSKHIPKCFLAVAFCAAALFSGCERNETPATSGRLENSVPSTPATPPELPIEQQTEQKLDPLTKEDVELYLKVMRAAAERVKNPQASDQAAADGARRILAGRASGRVPTPDDVKTLERATLVALYMDQIVAEEMKLNGRTYRGIAEAVESDALNPTPALPHGDAAVPAAEPAPTPLESRLSAVNAANKKSLAPYREQIQKLIAVVRNPANLPK
jgi:hypothetical protein